MRFTIILEWDEVTVYEHINSTEVQKFLINGEDSLRYTQVDYSNKMTRLGTYLKERLQCHDFKNVTFSVIHHNANLDVLKVLSEALLPCTCWNVYQLEDILPLILISMNKLKVGESIVVCFKNDTRQVSIDKQGVFTVQPVKNVVGYAIEPEMIPTSCLFNVKSLAEQYADLHIQSSEQINKFQTRSNQEKQKYELLQQECEVRLREENQRYELLQRECESIKQAYDSLLHYRKTYSEENLKNFYDVGKCFVKIAAATSAANGLNPIVGVDVAADLGIIMKLFTEIREIFAVEDEKLKVVAEKISEFNEIVERISNFKTADNLKSVILDFAAKRARKFIPLIGAPVAATAGYSFAYNIGTRYLQDCYIAATVIAEYEQHGEENAKSKLGEMIQNMEAELIEEGEKEGFFKKGIKKIFK